MLQPVELDEFRTDLNRQLEELLGKAAREVAELLNSKDRFVDPLDIASLESSRTTILRLRDRERKLIRKIIETLQRIEEGTFGICEICGEAIGLARLRARPITSHCIRCKTRLESNERLIEAPHKSTGRHAV